ncbi:MAG TPA: NUDIX hydrolase [Actinomycetota bacterium]
MSEPASARRAFDGRHVRVDQEEWPGIGTWEVVRPLDAVCVLPVTPSGDVVLVRQFRPPVRRHVLELPAGLLDVDGEDPETCAVRELEEETGYRAVSIRPLAELHPSVGHSSELVHLFLARIGTEPEGPPEEGIELVRRPLAEAAAEARAGRIADMKTALALLLADEGPAAG